MTQAADAALSVSKKYPASYPLNKSTLDLLGKYTGDLHNLYRALFITNIKAVNGRYGENEKTLPKFKPLNRREVRDITDLSRDTLQSWCDKFDDYMYQIAEDPICGSPIFAAWSDIYRLLAMLLFKKQRYAL